MSQTKFFKAKYIVVWDEGQHKTLENGFLGVKNKEISGFYKDLPEGAVCEDLGASAIVPGFINIHSHPSEVYNMKSFWEDIGNPCFYESCLYDYAFSVDLGERGAQLQATLNIAEIIKSGCTTGLIYGGAYSGKEAEIAGKLGWRAYVGGTIRAGDPVSAKGLWHTPNGHMLEINFDSEAGKRRFDEALAFIRDYDGTYDGRIHTLLAPTQTLTCTPEMLMAIRKKADEIGIGITIHGAEDLFEFENCLRMYGKTPVRFMADTGMLGKDVIVAHCFCVQGFEHVRLAGNEDLELLGKTGTSVAHCPTALARTGLSLQSFKRYNDMGINVGLGTDSYPSDYVLEMRMAAFMGKGVEKSTFGMSAKDAFYAATVNGAKAFGRKDLGRLAPGAKADFAVFKLDNIEMTPVRDVLKNIVYSATRHSVDRVYVEGRCIAKNGLIEGLDESALCGELQELMEAAWEKIRMNYTNGKPVNELSPLSAPLLNL